MWPRCASSPLWPPRPLTLSWHRLFPPSPPLLRSFCTAGRRATRAHAAAAASTPSPQQRAAKNSANSGSFSSFRWSVEATSPEPRLCDPGQQPRTIGGHTTSHGLESASSQHGRPHWLPRASQGGGLPPTHPCAAPGRRHAPSSSSSSTPPQQQQQQRRRRRRRQRQSQPLATQPPPPCAGGDGGCHRHGGGRPGCEPAPQHV
jgi:hypothetical protein